ncbi:hypothetical protein [Agrobacterium tumefaciens]|uniref:hypothetical protein n=1 Tax=Agrobacterium tumefaciens TaxID=358 RepID=UPI002244254D|nr:hypothetical protein [Agrobacterium tumefaciens]MCW8060511.1 hypothetical protein [Agrobacterium tumefaciens]MCW8145955.1 hypothetical protein [Agrobacterium tumefaciens]
MRIGFSTIGIFATVLCTLAPRMVSAQDIISTGCYTTPAKDCLPKVDIPPQTSADKLHEAYAQLAWQDFVALSLPVEDAAKDGKLTSKPDVARGLSSYADRKAHPYKPVWETFTSADDLFQTGVTEPIKFGSLPMLPTVCSEKLTADQKNKPPVLANIAKSGIQDEYVQANRMGPVIDRNGNYLRYGIGFNEVMHDHVVRHKLFSSTGQDDFSKTSSRVEWPQKGDTAGSAGSIFVKSSWKIIAGEDNPDDFYTMDALIYTPRHGTFGEEPTIATDQCEVKQVGLVGLHIVHRTPSAPQWVWATFEHTNNAPYYDEIDTAEKVKTLTDSKIHYSLFDINKCVGAAGSVGCRINQVPDHPWNPLDIHKEKATQVVRMVRPGKKAAEMNKKIAEKLDSVKGPWKNYSLVDVQFPTVLLPPNADGVARENPAYPDGVPTPSFLANSTMETYIQGIPSADMHGVTTGVPRVTSSCVSCHYDATTSAGTNSNFVFSLSRVKK